MMGVGAKRAIGLYRSCAPRQELTGNSGHFCADWAVFSRANLPGFKWLAGNPLFRKNREFEMFDQGIALGRTGN